MYTELPHHTAQRERRVGVERRIGADRRHRDNLPDYELQPPSATSNHSHGNPAMPRVDARDRPPDRRTNRGALTALSYQEIGASPLPSEARDVLLVEDDADVREIVTTLLTGAGFTVDEADDGVTALGYLRTHRYRLLLLDLVMPHLDGFGVLAALGQERSQRPPAIVVLSALHEQATVMRALEGGADDYLTKPFAIDEFVLRVSLWLRRASPAAPPPTTGLRIHSLGRFYVEHGGEIRLHEGRRARKAGTLFKYLLSHQERPIPTAEVLSLLWPQAPEDLAATDLRSLLYSLRRLLGYPTGGWSCLEHVGATVALRLGRDDWWDVNEFTTLLAQGARWHRMGEVDRALDSYAAGVALYSGDYLEADAYVDWVRPCREQFRGQWLRALSAISLLHGERGEHDKQELILRTLLRADPYHEPSYRALMSLLARHGRSAEMLVLYRDLERLLRSEFGASPDPETQALVARLG